MRSRSLLMLILFVIMISSITSGIDAIEYHIKTLIYGFSMVVLIAIGCSALYYKWKKVQ
ncbi:hypothetical protein [Halobacillus sp. B23F22_1]|uniref:hypothetical protein n=1 Tax=Halobacillus sp. B23F22_1 TaxID=3459514 RepID=UPI00373E0AFF